MSQSPLQPVNASAAKDNRNLVAWSWLAGLILFAVLAIPFFAGRIYTGDDLGAFHLPLRAFYARQIAEGGAYDWMPQLFSGFYLTGEGQAGMYHPLHQLLYRAFPLRAALGWEYLLPYPIMMLGTWLFLRRRLEHGGAAVFGALVFTYSSFNLLHFVHPNALAIIAHLPWLLWAIDIVLVDSRRRRVGLAALFISLLTASQLLLGYPQYLWFSLLAEGAYAVFLVKTRRYAPRRECNLIATCEECIGCATETWPKLLIAVGTGLLLGGVQWLPSLDAWLNSARLNANQDFACWGSLHPLNLFQLVAPYLFTDRTVGGSHHEYGLYAGAVPVVLAVWLLAKRRELGLLGPLVWTAFGSAAVILLLSLGKYGVLYPVVSWLPGLNAFRFPARYLVLFQLSLTVLAAIGFLLLLRENRQARLQTETYQKQHARLALWRDFEPVWCLVALATAVAAVGVVLFHEPYIASIPAILAGPVLFAIAALFLVAAARGRRWAFVGLILLAAADLGWYGMGGTLYPSNRPLDAFVATAKTPPGEPRDRVLTTLLSYDKPGLRTGNLMILHGWSRADGYAGLEPRQRLDYTLLPALRVAGVRWVQQNPQTNKITGLRVYDGQWYEVPDPLPRARLVTSTRKETDPACDIARISLEKTALTEVPIGLPASEPGTAVLTSESPGRLDIAVDCPASQLLVVAESYHRGWLARIDGVSSPVYRTNGDFIGCVVGPGKHRVILTFEPDSLRHGWLLSCIGLGMIPFCFLGCAASPRRKRLVEIFS